MKRLLPLLALATLTRCANFDTAEQQWCDRHPGQCADAGPSADGGTDAGADAGTDAGEPDAGPIPVVLGDPRIGRKLSFDAGDWPFDPQPFTHQWLLCTDDGGCTAAATSSLTYTPQDEGLRVAIEVTPRPGYPGGAAPVRSAPTGPVARLTPTILQLDGFGAGLATGLFESGASYQDAGTDGYTVHLAHAQGSVDQLVRRYGQSDGVVHFAFRVTDGEAGARGVLAELPFGTTTQLAVQYGVDDHAVYLVARSATGTTTRAFAVSLSPGWHRVDLHVDASSAPSKLTGWLDGVAPSELPFAQPNPTTADDFVLGSADPNSPALTVDFDDFIEADDPTDAPIEAGHALRLLPTSIGFSDPLKFGNNTSGAVSLRDWPPDGGTISQSVTGATDYAEFQFDQPPANATFIAICARTATRGLDSHATTQLLVPNARPPGPVGPYSSDTESAVDNVSFYYGTPCVLPAANVPFTSADLAQAKVRWGFSDGGFTPIMDAVLLEAYQLQ